MATVRLSNYIKETVISSLLSHAFDEREKALDKEWFALGDAVY